MTDITYGLINTTANFSIKYLKSSPSDVIPGLTQNPERIENTGFPTKDFGNDEKIRCSISNKKEILCYNEVRRWL